MSIQQNFPAISPSLSLNFARSKTLDPRITFTRTSTATRVNGQGLIEVVGANTPRFDHSYDPVSGTVKSLGLLIEEQRENLIRYSGIVGTMGTKPTGFQFASSIVGQSCEVSTDFDIDGNGNCIKHIRGESGDNNVGYTTTIGTLVSGTTYTFSVYVYIPLSQKNNITSIRFGPDNGYSSVTFGFADLNITDRWQRVIGSFVSNGGGGVLCRATASNGAFFYTDAWQLEEGAFPTSYIPTTNSTATRTADNASMVGENFSSWYNQSEGTFVTQHRQQDMKDLSVNYGIYSLSNSPTNTERLRFFSGAGRTPVFNTIVDGSTIAYLNAGSSLGVNLSGREGDLLKITTSYSQEDAAMVVEKSDVAIDDEDIVTPSLLNNMIIGGGGAGLKELCGHISQFTYYPRRLTNTQLQNLTK